LKALIGSNSYYCLTPQAAPMGVLEQPGGLIITNQNTCYIVSYSNPRKVLLLHR
jgi:hypothetical protein